MIITAETESRIIRKFHGDQGALVSRLPAGIRIGRNQIGSFRCKRPMPVIVPITLVQFERERRSAFLQENSRMDYLIATYNFRTTAFFSLTPGGGKTLHFSNASRQIRLNLIQTLADRKPKRITPKKYTTTS